MVAWHKKSIIKDIHFFPVWVLLALAVSVKVIAFIVIYLTFDSLSLAILDAFLFLILLSPLLVVLVFIPMAGYLRERKEFEKKLLENEIRLKWFYESELLGVYYWNIEGVITDANQKFLKLTGYSMEELTGGKILWLNLSPREYWEKDSEYLGEAIRNVSNEKSFERELVRKDGQRIWVVTASALLNRNPIQGVAYILDITERKQLEELRKNYRLELEEMVRIRTRELNAAKEKAESADRLKSSFLANVSHEFRTPLNSIIGFSSMALMELAGTLNEEQKKQLNMIKASGDHLLGLVNGLIELAQAESEEFRVDCERFSLQELIEEIIKRELPAAISKGLTIEFEKADIDCRIYSDKEKVSRILLAVINNTVKFTKEGSVRIVCNKDQDQLSVEISDTGIGMNEQDLEDLFQPFKKSGDYLIRQSAGAGLGLSIYKKIIEKLNGSMEVRSKYGEGSTFICSFPVGNENRET